MASSVMGGRYQQYEYLNVAPVFTGAKPNRASVELASPTSFSESMFSGYDDIVEACSIVWIDFVSEAKRVTTMCSRDWLEVRKT